MERLYFSISEVSQLVDEEQHILRYWEKEFSQIKPKKNRGGNRVYSKRDIELIKLVKKLMRTEKLSLKGAKDYIGKLDLAKLDFDNIMIVDNSSYELSSKSDIKPKTKENKKLHSETNNSENQYSNNKVETQSISDVEEFVDSEIMLKKSEMKDILALMKEALELLKN